MSFHHDASKQFIVLSVLVSVQCAVYRTCKVGELTPDDDNCSKYFTCKRGLKVPLQCPFGLYFNPFLKTCDQVDDSQVHNITSCRQLFSQPQDQIETPEFLGPQKFYSSQRNSKQQTYPSKTYTNGCPLSNHVRKLLPHEDCSKFYICSFGQKQEKKCPAGLNFDSKMQVCNWPSLVKCGGHLTTKFTTKITTMPTTEPTTTAIPTTNTSAKKKRAKKKKKKKKRKTKTSRKTKAKPSRKKKGKAKKTTTEATTTETEETTTPEPTTVSTTVTDSTTTDSDTDDTTTETLSTTEETTTEAISTTTTESLDTTTDEVTEKESTTLEISTTTESSTDYTSEIDTTTVTTEFTTVESSTDNISTRDVTTVDSTTAEITIKPDDVSTVTTTELDSDYDWETTLSSTSKSKLKTTTTTKTTTNGFPICPQGSFMNLPHPKLCNTFYMCVGGTIMQLYCADGLEFDPVTNICVKIKKDGCTHARKIIDKMNKNIIRAPFKSFQAPDNNNNLLVNGMRPEGMVEYRFSFEEEELVTSTSSTTPEDINYDYELPFFMATKRGKDAETTSTTEQVDDETTTALTVTSSNPTTAIQDINIMYSHENVKESKNIIKTTTSSEEDITETWPLIEAPKISQDISFFRDSSPVCPPEFYGTVADPASCSSYYECSGGDTNHLHCPSGHEYAPLINSCVLIEPGGCTISILSLY